MQDLGLRPSDFWLLTPRQFAALCERRALIERRADSRAALIASVIANVHRDPQQRPSPYTVEDFLPQAPSPAVAGEDALAEQQAAMLRALATALGGDVAPEEAD